MNKWTQTITLPTDTRGWGDNKRTLPAIEAKIELSIDLNAVIQRFGAKAARSKGGRSAALGGLVRIKVLKQKEVT